MPKPWIIGPRGWWRLINKEPMYQLNVAGFSNDPVNGSGVKLSWTWPPAGFIGSLDPQYAELYIQKSTSTNNAINTNWPLKPNFVKNVGTQSVPTPESEWETIAIIEVPPQYMDNDTSTPWRFTNYNDQMNQPPAVNTYYRLVAFINTDPQGPTFVECDWGTAAYPKTVAEFNWVKDFGGLGFQDKVIGKAVAIDRNDNSVVVIGEYIGSGCSIEGTALPASGNGVFVAKYSKEGVKQWVNAYYGTNNKVFAGGVAVDSNGNVIITGSFDQTVNFGSGNVTSNNSSPGNPVIDVFIVKLSSTGNWIWDKHFGGTSNDSGSGVAVDNSDNIIVVGYVTGTMNFGNGDVNGIGLRDIFVAKYDSSINGNYVWAKRFGNTGDRDAATCIAVDPLDASGNIVVGGIFQDNLNFGNGTAILSGDGSQDCFIVKLSSTGTATWAIQVTGPINDSIDAVAVDGNGNVAFTGGTYGTLTFRDTNSTNTPLVLSTNVKQAFFAKCNSTGVLQWVKKFDESALGESGRGVAFDSNGNVIFTGYTKSTINDFFGVMSDTSQQDNIFIGKYSSSDTGQPMWGKRYQNIYSGPDHGNRIAVDTANNIIVTGDRSGRRGIDAGGLLDFGGGEVQSSKADTDAFLLKLGP